VALAVEAAFPAMSVTDADGAQIMFAAVLLIDGPPLGEPRVNVMLAPLRVIVVAVPAPRPP
jgi:hypothetical protein